MNFIINGLKMGLLKSIRFYQNNFSPDYGPKAILHPHGFCRFQPTCSEYAYQAVYKYGIIKGLLKGTWRLLRCHPFSKGGNDPVK